MDTLLQIVRQENIEHRFNPKLIDRKLRDFMMASDHMRDCIGRGVDLLKAYCEGSYYESKNARVAQVKLIDLEQLVTDILIGICYFQVPTLFTSVTSQMAGRLGFDDKRSAILTVSEILAILCETDAFDIEKASAQASLTLVSRIPLSDELIEFCNNAQYLPPMVCTPLELDNNYSSGYLTHKDSLILGTGNHHNGDICLDVLNTLNKVALSLDMEFLCQCEEDPKREFTVEKIIEAHDKKGKFINEAQAKELLSQQVANWQTFKAQSQKIYLMLHGNGNRFHLTHKVDKRGRIYAQGYHVSTQGAAYKKAAVELAKQELIEGVPGTP